jgi:nitrogen fixation NifU-like protein
MSDATNIVDGFNPLCGDHYKIYLKLEKDIVKEVSFEGSGCAISKASASLMSVVMKGKTRAEAEKLFHQFHSLVTEGSSPEPTSEEMERLAPFAGVSEYPARVKCAILAWHTVHSALEGKSEPISTE